MQAEVKKIVAYAQEYLEVDRFSDICFNGLQVEGAPQVSKVISGVTLSQRLINTAIKKRVKMLLVHHGWVNMHFPYPVTFTAYRKERLKLLLANNINVAGFHLPLDAHPIIGNNISLLKLLKLKKTGVIHSPKYGDVGFVGELPEAIKLSDFVARVDESLEAKSQLIEGGPKKVRTIGIIGGRAGDEYTVAKEMGVDTFLTGELNEEHVRAAEETKVNMIIAGHYNTEKLGIQNLGELIAKKFGIRHEFVDVPCEI